MALLLAIAQLSRPCQLHILWDKGHRGTLGSQPPEGHAGVSPTNSLSHGTGFTPAYSPTQYPCGWVCWGIPFIICQRRGVDYVGYVIRDGGATIHEHPPDPPSSSYLVDSLSIQSKYLSGNSLIISILVAPNRLTKHLQDPHIPPAAVSEQASWCISAAWRTLAA